MTKTRLVIIGIILMINTLCAEWEFSHVLDRIDLDVSNSCGMHGVTLDPDGNIWYGMYASGGAWAYDTLDVNGEEVYILPIFAMTPQGDPLPFSPVYTLTIEGLTDTLTSGCRGMATGSDGHILYSVSGKLYKINYQTGEGIAVYDFPEVTGGLTKPAVDNSGRIYISTVAHGNPVKILDSDLTEIANALDDNSGGYNRAIAITGDGRDLYLGSVWNGVGIRHFYSPLPGVLPYEPVDTIGGWWMDDASWFQPMWAEDVSLNPFEDQLYAASSEFAFTYDDVHHSRWYIYDRVSGEELDSFGIPEGDYATGGVYNGRGAAWSADGRTMYVADYGYNSITVWNLTGTGPDSVHLEIPLAYAAPDYTITLPVNVAFPFDFNCDTAVIGLGGFQDHLEFTGIITEGGMLQDANWSIEYNETDTLIITLGTSDNGVRGAGTLFWLEFYVPDTLENVFVPVTIDTALFNNGDADPVMVDGGLQILESAFFGDVDLNMDVRAFDASQILKYLVDLIELEPQQLLNSDVSLDGTVSAFDATLILQYVVGLIDGLPFIPGPDLQFASGGMSMESAMLMPGAMVEVPLLLQNPYNIYSFQGQIDYDVQHLNLVSIEWTELADGVVTEWNSQNGFLRFAGAGEVEPGLSDVLAIMQFQVSDQFNEEHTNISLSKLRFNEEDLQEDVALVELNYSMLNLELSEMPVSYDLLPNYPNPFNPLTSISYDLPVEGEVSLHIFDLKGRLVHTLVQRRQSQGRYAIRWNGTSDSGYPVSAGVYLCHLQAGDYSETIKMLYLR
ncbi:MAG: T9SS type A sorting domain-containing protein [Candidatus Marinimicrobia bacterium]|nr:T9SS type A sorting domain-containing protein [Candidatus Neomarinimicrobiota bacterium]